MNRKFLLTAWAVLFLSCALLGLIPNPHGILRVAMTVLSLLFFVPGFLLVRSGRRSTVELVRNLSIASLALTLVLIIANILSFSASQAVGNLLYILLTVVSAPMVCSGYWVVSLFFWACLMIVCLQKLKKR